MKLLNYYTYNKLDSEDRIFEYLLESLRSGVADWEYFVNWNKVFSNTRQIEATLNIMNYLLGKEDFDKEFRYLAGKYPEILQMIPVLIVRNGEKSSSYSVVTVNGSALTEEVFNFSKSQPIDDKIIENAIRFIRNSGLIRIFKEDGVKSLVDYVLGVEAGLGSNGRKNRGGTAMENVCNALLSGMGLHYIQQASAADIQREFGITLTGMEGRRFDFATAVKGKLIVIEVNCYSSGGSKLDKTASDYRGLQDELRGQATFVWITDGYGWLKAHKPLRKSFDHNDYILNIEMINRGALAEILGQE